MWANQVKAGVKLKQGLSVFLGLHSAQDSCRASFLAVVSSCSMACPVTPALSENPTSLLQFVWVEGPPKLILLGWVWGAPLRLSPGWGFVVEQITISSNGIQIAIELLA